MEGDIFPRVLSSKELGESGGVPSVYSTSPVASTSSSMVVIILSPFPFKQEDEASEGHLAGRARENSFPCGDEKKAQAGDVRNRLVQSKLVGFIRKLC